MRLCKGPQATKVCSFFFGSWVSWTESEDSGNRMKQKVFELKGQVQLRRSPETPKMGLYLCVSMCLTIREIMYICVCVCVVLYEFVCVCVCVCM